MKGLNAHIVYFYALSILLALKVEISVAETAIERSNRVAWDAIELKERGADSEQSQRAEEFKFRVDEFLRNGQFHQESESAKNVYHSTRVLKDTGSDKDLSIERMFSKNKIYVFVSTSMPRGELVSLFGSLNNLDDIEIEVAYRGLLPGNRTLVDFSKELGLMVRELGLKSTVPVVGLNPTMFRELQVGSVPQMAFIHDNKTFSRISGSINIREFISKVGKNNGAPADFGIVGNVYKIAEKDFFLEIQERLAKIDWKTIPERAQKKYWTSLKPITLPEGSLSRRYDVDMTVEVTQDIKASDGQKEYIIARKGDQFNPLNQQLLSRFNRRIIGFNPNIRSQKLWAIEQVKDALKNNQQPVVMISELLSEKHGDTFGLLESDLKARIFILPSLVIERFEIQSLPFTVERSVVNEGSMSVTLYRCSDLECSL